MGMMPKGIRALAKSLGIRLRFTRRSFMSFRAEGWRYWRGSDQYSGEVAPTRWAQAYIDPNGRPCVVVRVDESGEGRHYEAVTHELAHMALDIGSQELPVVELQVTWLAQMPQAQAQAVERVIRKELPGWELSSELLDAWAQA